MPDKVRFEYRELASGQFAITSPDIAGFCLVAESAAKATSQALEVIGVIRSREAGAREERVSSVEY